VLLRGDRGDGDVTGRWRRRCCQGILRGQCCRGEIEETVLSRGDKGDSNVIGRDKVDSVITGRDT
jgi:hypothetical protein